MFYSNSEQQETVDTNEIVKKRTAPLQQELKLKEDRVKALTRQIDEREAAVTKAEQQHAAAAKAMREKHQQEMELLQTKLKAAQRKQKNKGPINTVAGSDKRQKTAMVADPSGHINTVFNMVKNLFHFIVHLERVNGKFIVRDALRHGYMREAASRNQELEIDQADDKANSRLRYLDLSRAGVTQEKVGKTKAAAIEYPALADLLLTEFEWFRSIHSFLVGNMLLPTPELHVSLIGYLAEIEAEITPAVVQAILGIDMAVATRIVSRLQQHHQLPVCTNADFQRAQCVHMIKGNSRQPPRQCKKFGKIAANVALPLCSYHRAKESIP